MLNQGLHRILAILLVSSLAAGCSHPQDFQVVVDNESGSETGFAITMRARDGDEVLDRTGHLLSGDEATFTILQLKRGTYTFHVEAGNRTGNYELEVSDSVFWAEATIHNTSISFSRGMT